MSTRRHSRVFMFAIALAAVMAGSGSLAGPVSAARFRFEPAPWLDLAMTVNRYFPGLGQAAQAAIGPTALTYSGKLTVLLVGSDWRDNHNTGERIDSIMVVSINPSSKQISAVSIPRDTARIPLPPALGGGTFHGKINTMFKYFKKQTGSRDVALERFRQAVAYTLDIKIDYVGYLRFEGFDALIDAAGGVPTYIPNELRDPSYIDKPGWPTGAKFLASSSALLKGGSAPRCYGGYPKPVTNWGPVINCTRALVYVRSRHGSLVGCCGNSDYKRAARQQRFVYDAIKRILFKGVVTAKALRAEMLQDGASIYTTMPTGDADIIAMINLLTNATFPNSVVSHPRSTRRTFPAPPRTSSSWTSFGACATAGSTTSSP
jgi:anionic cell wall polymer biosynthesis LytR-Cps2A-Psr (LCP) family protein